MTPVERQITATALRRYAAEQRRRRPHLDEIGEDFAALLEAATASRLANIADRLAAALEAETASESAQLVAELTAAERIAEHTGRAEYLEEAEPRECAGCGRELEAGTDDDLCDYCAEALADDDRRAEESDARRKGEL